MEEHIATVGWQNTLRRVTDVVPLARWPLLLGAVLALPLPFVPWFTVQFCGLTCDNSAAAAGDTTINPL